MTIAPPEAGHTPETRGGYALELDQVSARYASGARAREAGAAKREHTPLERVTLAVSTGELLAVLGPNGAGKSTLLRVMSGSLAPYEGEVRLFGECVGGAGSPSSRTLDRRDVARRVAVVAQSEAVAFGFTVREVVAMGRAPHQGAWMREGARDREVIDATLARCDLVALAARPVDELSGGEQKRVAIARALAQEPRVLLLDEPAAFLDVRHQVDLFELLLEEVNRAKLACVVVMHDLNVAAQYASRVGLMKDGALVAVGAIEEVMTYRRLRDVFDADLYVGVNDITRDRFFLPMRKKIEES